MSIEMPLLSQSLQSSSILLIMESKLVFFYVIFFFFFKLAVLLFLNGIFTQFSADEHLGSIVHRSE